MANLYPVNCAKVLLQDYLFKLQTKYLIGKMLQSIWKENFDKQSQRQHTGQNVNFQTVMKFQPPLLHQFSRTFNPKPSS